MDFYHPRLEKWIPKNIFISDNEYMKKFECKKCEKDLQDFKKVCPGYERGTKLQDDLFFNIYYWILPNSKNNHYAYIESIESLKAYFELYDTLYDPIPKLTKIAYEISMVNLVSLCTYHTLWLHTFYHQMYKLEGCYMPLWDDMHQSDHVKAKNELDLLIYFLLTCKNRKEVLQEICNFTLCPPVKQNGICGYEYKRAKQRFEENVST
jgi:hypothetical protein